MHLRAHLGERSDLLVAIGIKVLLCVVDGHPSVDSVRKSSVLHNGHAFVTSILVFEEHGSCPVVATKY